MDSLVYRCRRTVMFSDIDSGIKNYLNESFSQNIAITLKVSESIDGNNKDTVKAEMIKELLKDVNQHINDNKPKT